MSKKNGKKAVLQPVPIKPEKIMNDRIEVKPDHLKVLKEVHRKEQEALFKLAQATLRIENLQAQIDKLRGEVLKPQEEEVYRQRNYLKEMGMSFMHFYDLQQNPGYVWRLVIDEGAWIKVPLPKD